MSIRRANVLTSRSAVAAAAMLLAASALSSGTARAGGDGQALSALGNEELCTALDTAIGKQFDYLQPRAQKHSDDLDDMQDPPVDKKTGKRPPTLGADKVELASQFAHFIAPETVRLNDVRDRVNGTTTLAGGSGRAPSDEEGGQGNEGGDEGGTPQAGAPRGGTVDPGQGPATPPKLTDPKPSPRERLARWASEIGAAVTRAYQYNHDIDSDDKGHAKLIELGIVDAKTGKPKDAELHRFAKLMARVKTLQPLVAFLAGARGEVKKTCNELATPPIAPGPKLGQTPASPREAQATDPAASPTRTADTGGETPPAGEGAPAPGGQPTGRDGA